ncbi:MAG: efflux RND transporter periplasmic adaptor subunit [Bryobacteraceae bacterium]
MKKILIPLALVLAAAFAWIYQKKSDPPEMPFAKVKRETLVSMLPTNGKVEPFEWQIVHAEIAGAVERVSVRQGEAVAKGALLASVKIGGAQTELAAAESQIAKARAGITVQERGGRPAELAEIENGLAKAKLDRETSQREYDTLNRLVEKGAATRAEALAAQSAIRQADLVIESLQRRRASLVDVTERSVSEAQLREAQAAAAQVKVRVGEAAIRSPLSGIVYNLAVRQGGYLNPGDPVASVGRLDKLRVRVYVDEPELGRVAKGQPVTISCDALPGEKWTGTVEDIPTEIQTLGTRQVGQVIVTIENEGGKLVPGTNINAEIRTNVMAGALTIPKEAQRREGVETGVFVLRGDRLAWQKLVTGVSSATRVQVVSGLNEGDPVALPTERPLKNGDLVKPVYP